jgi:hypothetical protein
MIKDAVEIKNRQRQRLKDKQKRQMIKDAVKEGGVGRRF